MTSPYLQLQLSTTRALLKFIRDHNGNVDQDLLACLGELEGENIGAAIRHARSVKPHGMGGITDWFPAPINEQETPEYLEQVLRALTNEWCRVISLSFEDRDTVSRNSQKGEIEARVRPNGYVLCPFCGKTFSSTSPSSWDGTRHLSCSVRLKLIPE